MPRSKCCPCPESAHTLYGAEKVCEICGVHYCRGWRSVHQTCLDCGMENVGHDNQADCLKALRERIEALEDTRGSAS